MASHAQQNGLEGPLANNNHTLQRVSTDFASSPLWQTNTPGLLHSGIFVALSATHHLFKHILCGGPRWKRLLRVWAVGIAQFEWMGRAKVNLSLACFTMARCFSSLFLLFFSSTRSIRLGQVCKSYKPLRQLFCIVKVRSKGKEPKFLNLKILPRWMDGMGIVRVQSIGLLR